MAAIAIPAILTAAGPLITAAAPLLMPVIADLVTRVEHLFGAKSGPTKLGTVVNAVTPIAEQLSTAGAIPGQLDAASITAMIEAVIQSLKAGGLLGGPAPGGSGVPAASAQVQPGSYAVSGVLKIG